jgi:hypothetical protein
MTFQKTWEIKTQNTPKSNKLMNLIAILMEEMKPQKKKNTTLVELNLQNQKIIWIYLQTDHILTNRINEKEV